MNSMTLTTSITINAPAEKVWQALTDPEIIKQYFFGTEVNTDWRAGSPITWTGEWQGKTYQDKGEIVDITPGEYVKYTYWSSMSGKEDKPDNYANVTYQLTDLGSKTELTLTQDNIADESSKEHSEQNWQMVLGGMKKLIETCSM